MRGIAMVKLAYMIISTMPGIPCIYYGDEVGMEGYRDPFNRRPFPWNKSKTRPKYINSKEESLTEWFRLLGKIRHEEKALWNGAVKIIHCNSDILIFARYVDRESLVAVINRSENKYQINSEMEFIDITDEYSLKKDPVIQPLSGVLLKPDNGMLTEPYELGIEKL